MRQLPFLNYFVLSSFCFAVLGCASTQNKETHSTCTSIQGVNLRAIQYFSPPYDPTEPEDFHAVANAQLVCETPEHFYAEFLNPVRSKVIRECLNSLKTGSVQYQFRFQAKPELVLDSEEKTNPPCLVQVLASIPLPREIYFLGVPVQSALQDCYSASVNVKQRKPLDFEFLSKDLNVVIPFPLSRPLKNDTDLKLWLTVTTLDLLSHFKKGERYIQGDYVPGQLCRECFQNDPWFNDKLSRKIPPAQWP